MASRPPRCQNSDNLLRKVTRLYRLPTSRVDRLTNRQRRRLSISHLCRGRSRRAAVAPLMFYLRAVILTTDSDRDEQVPGTFDVRDDGQLPVAGRE